MDDSSKVSTKTKYSILAKKTKKCTRVITITATKKRNQKKYIDVVAVIVTAFCFGSVTIIIIIVTISIYYLILILYIMTGNNYIRIWLLLFILVLLLLLLLLLLSLLSLCEGTTTSHYGTIQRTKTIMASKLRRIVKPDTMTAFFHYDHHYHRLHEASKFYNQYQQYQQQQTIRIKTRIKTHSSSIRLMNNNNNNNNNNNSNSNDIIVINDDDMNENIRAGESGYSILRRPLSSSWYKPIDDNTIIDNDDDTNIKLEDDQTWWNTKQQKEIQPKQQQELGVDEQEEDNNSDDIELNLKYRTYETLDYGTILNTIQDICSTVPAKTIIQDAIRMITSNTPSTLRSNSIKTSTKTSKDKEDILNNIIYQPFIADSCIGCQNRYQYVQEMKWLLEDNDDVSNKIRWNDRKSIKRELYGVPPPIYSGSKFDLNMIVNNMKQSKNKRSYLKGNEICDITRMMDIIENVILWKKNGLCQVLNNNINNNNKNTNNNNNNNNQYHFKQLITLVDGIEFNTTLHQLLHDAFEDIVPLSTSSSSSSTTTTRKRVNVNDDDDDDESSYYLNGTTFPKIGELRSTIKILKDQILEILQQYIKTLSPSIISNDSGGSIISEMNGRLVIPVIQSSTIMDGIIHDTSRSGKTVYIEPKVIIELTNQLRSIENEYQNEILYIWKYITEQILLNIISLQNNIMIIGQLDMIYAKYQFGYHILGDGIIPIVYNDGIISLYNVKHPILLLKQYNNKLNHKNQYNNRNKSNNNNKSLSTDSIVGNDIHFGIGNKQGLILTGPNAGGKTIILKLLGLIAFMARCGIPIPASLTSSSSSSTSASTGSSTINSVTSTMVDNNDYDQYTPRVDFFDPILADIGDMQDVDRDLSTFSGHMVVCREVLKQTSLSSSSTSSSSSVLNGQQQEPPPHKRRPLVLMDELGSGTSPNEGVAIAQAILEALMDSGAKVVITTHYTALKQLSLYDDRFLVGGMEFRNGKPTYRFILGMIGESYAISVAERLQLPKSIIIRANELLDDNTRNMGILLNELEQEKVQLHEQSLLLQEKMNNIQEMEDNIKLEQEKLIYKQLNIRKEEAKKFTKQLEDKELILQNILERIKNDPTRKVLAKSWNDIQYMKRDIYNEAENIIKMAPTPTSSQNNDDAIEEELIPIAEIRNPSEIKIGDTLIVCQVGPLYGIEGIVIKLIGNNRVEIRLKNNNMNISFKLTQVAFPISSSSSSSSSLSSNKNNRKINSSADSNKPGGNDNKRNRLSKAIEREIESEKMLSSKVTTTMMTSEQRSSSSSMMRTESNTVNVLGCNLLDAQEKTIQKISSMMKNNKKTIYILHGHGTGGILKTKIRNWLKQVQQQYNIKSYSPADQSDGGDALTRVELK